MAKSGPHKNIISLPALPPTYVDAQMKRGVMLVVSPGPYTKGARKMVKGSDDAFTISSAAKRAFATPVHG